MHFHQQEHSPSQNKVSEMLMLIVGFASSSRRES
jgi:hypothetical protein